MERTIEAWVKWNAKEITGDDFAVAFRKEFHYETSRAWDERTNPQKLIRENIKRVHRDNFRRRIQREMVKDSRSVD